MAKAVKRPAGSWVYVLKSDRALGDREQSRFTLSPLTIAQRFAVDDDMLRSDGFRLHRSALDLALDHVVSVENFPAEGPQPWPRKRDERERFLDLLSDEHVMELGNEVYERSKLGEDAYLLKNSPTPGDTSSSGESPTTMPSSIPAPPVSAIPS